VYEEKNRLDISCQQTCSLNTPAAATIYNGNYEVQGFTSLLSSLVVVAIDDIIGPRTRRVLAVISEHDPDICADHYHI